MTLGPVPFLARLALAFFARRFRRYLRRSTVPGASWPGATDAECQLELRRSLAPLLQAFHPTQGVCYHCRWPWAFVQRHVIWYAPCQGLFLTCGLCMEHIAATGAADTLIDYARHVWTVWQRDGGPEIELSTMEDAIRREVHPLRARLGTAL